MNANGVVLIQKVLEDHTVALHIPVNQPLYSENVSP